MATTARSTGFANLSRADWVGTVVVGGLALWLMGLATFVALLGAPYYLLDEAARPDSDLHIWFRPGARVGLLNGVIGTVLMVVMLVYSVRKWAGQAPSLGAPEWWLRFHQVCGIMGPVFIILHSGIQWPSGLVAVGFWCMLLVALSGIFGRYLFGHFPKAVADKSNAMRHVRRQLHDLRDRLVAETGETEDGDLVHAVQLSRSIDDRPNTLLGLALLDLEVARRKEHVRVLIWRSRLKPPVKRAATRALTRQLDLAKSIASWNVARRLFRYWHLFHEPLAVAMYGIIVFHVSTALLFGGVF